MEINLNIRNTENIERLGEGDIVQMQEIIEALVATGSLTGVKGGQAIIHFDGEGRFQKIEQKYFPWVRRKKFD
jgi:hypothetical protein